MTNWYHTYFGRTLLNAERLVLDKIISKLFGYYLVQLGGPDDYDFLLSSPIANKLRVDPSDLKYTDFVRAEFNTLPFLPESIDVIVISHILEFVRNSRAVLTEAYVSLVAEGNLIILGFNPFSLFGLLKFFYKHKEFPWNGRFMRIGKIQKWLHDLGFEIVLRRTCCFNLPLGKYCLHYPRWVESILNFLFPHCGASYIFVCKKKVIALTPLKERLLQKHLVLRESVSGAHYRESCEKN